MADAAKETVRQWMREVFAWDFAEKQRIGRAAMAAGLGFNPEGYARPFPGSNTTMINVNVPPDAAPETTPTPAPVETKAAPAPVTVLSPQVATPSPIAAVAPAVATIAETVKPLANGGLASLIKSTLLGAALLGSGGLGAFGLMALNRPAAVAPVAVTPTQPGAKPMEWEVRWKLGKDGVWQTQTVPVEPKP